MKQFFVLLGLCLFLSTVASQPVEKKTCTDLSGSYAFDGNWERLEVEGSNSRSIREDVLKTVPRFDERALSIFVRSVIEPKIVAAKQDLSTGVLTVDIFGAGISAQWKQYGPFLPIQISLTCVDRRWLRQTVAHGKSGFASTESRNQIYLQLDANGDLIAEGEKSIKSGLVFEDRLTLRWATKFRMHINGVGLH
jgi:hypothetical protein